jgi:hypothetical protein
LIGNPQRKNILWDHTGGKAAGSGVRSWTYANGQDISVEVLEVETGAGESGFSGGPALNTANEVVGVILAAREEKSPHVLCATPPAVRRQLARSYSTLAQKALLQGDIGHARALLARARRLSPDDAPPALLDSVLVILDSTRGVNP